MPVLTSYFWRFSFSENSYLSVSSWYRVSQSSLAFSLGGGNGQMRPEKLWKAAPSGLTETPWPGDPARAPPHLSLSSLRWSMLRGLRLSARTFFFISRAVCFLPLF